MDKLIILLLLILCTSCSTSNNAVILDELHTKRESVYLDGTEQKKLISSLKARNIDFFVKDNDVYVSEDVIGSRYLNKKIINELDDYNALKDKKGFVLFRKRILNLSKNKYETFPLNDFDKKVLPSIIEHNTYKYKVYDGDIYVESELMDNSNRLAKVIDMLEYLEEKKTNNPNIPLTDPASFDRSYKQMVIKTEPENP